MTSDHVVLARFRRLVAILPATERPLSLSDPSISQRCASLFRSSMVGYLTATMTWTTARRRWLRKSGAVAADVPSFRPMLASIAGIAQVAAGEGHDLHGQKSRQISSG